jgi:CheY-like chemotaxis protein
VIEAAVAVVTPGAAARAIVIEQRYEPVEQILADPNRLQQMFWNLLSNAVKFSANGCKVAITLSQANGHAVIEVADTGIGIDPEFLPYVFDRFRQADASTTRRYGGLGLGLSIVRHLAELHGGSVTVASAGKDLGASFTVSLPLAGAAAQAAGTVPGRGAGALPGIADFIPADLSGIRVLVIDDDMDARTLAASVLGQCGAQVMSAHSADDALAQLAHQAADVIVCDLGMPDADGFDFIRRLRSIESERGQRLPAPVIVLSAFTRDSDRARAHEAGFAAYLTKPVEPSLLVHTILANAKPQAVSLPP